MLDAGERVPAMLCEDVVVLGSGAERGPPALGVVVKAGVGAVLWIGGLAGGPGFE